MEIKKVIGILIIICVIVLSAAFLYSNQQQDLNNETQVNNTTNITKNNTTSNITNKTVDNANNVKHAESTIKSNNYQSQENKEPEYGSDSYVEKWDKSNKNGDDWAYTHSQPVKKEKGHKYKRMYDEDSGKSYWYQTDQDL